ncbi:MAG: ABC transporter ATP-binding protein [Lachnospiraceae bacterium]|nr:ABC transporter ATP-binding protein [Lachnospiraceae bacterium]
MIELNHVCKRYEHFSLDVSMRVKPGCITGFVGKNGAGKSTTFKLILGLTAAEGGQACVLGRSPAELTPRERQQIGVAMAESGFSTYLSIRDIAAILKQMYAAFSEGEFLEQCRRFELPTDQRIGKFSTGMKAKLKVLTAASHQAKLLVLDEPTSGLDVMARNELLDMLRDYMEQDAERSILISSHISSDLERLCDDIYLIHQGRILLHEDTDVLLGSYGILKADAAQYARLDPRYLIRSRREGFGYTCLTDQQQYYRDNYPDVVLEKGNLDDVILMMVDEAAAGM